MKRDKLIMVVIFAFVLIMTACGKRNDLKVGDEKNNSEADLVYIDYADAESFEAALNEGEDLEGKIVQFEALELHPDSAVGYNVWAGEHLNFISSSNPDIEVGEIVVVKCKVITSSLGSWFIKYEKVDNAVIGDETISSDKENATTSINNETEQLPLELVDYGSYIGESSEDMVYVNFCGMIHNPNEDLIAEFPTILVTVKDSEGAVLATEKQVGSIVMPGDTITLCGMFSILETNMTAEAQIYYDVEWSDYTKSTSMYSAAKTTDFDITNISEFSGSENSVTGEIKNNFSEDIDNINISMVLRKDGKIVYMENTFLDNLGTGQTKAFEFESYHDWPEHDTVEVSAMVW